MSRKLALAAALFAVALIAFTIPSAAADAKAPAVLTAPGTLAAGNAGICPATPILPDNGTAKQNATCIPQGQTCDPRYVPPDSVCCPGLQCMYLYPNVPKFCL